MKEDYKIFKEIVTKSEYFKLRPRDNFNDKQKEEAYCLYAIKATLLQKNGFKCDNLHCETPESILTLHHIKLRKNGGKNSLKNCVIVCDQCHRNFHSGKNELTLDGMTYRLDKMTNNSVKFCPKIIIAEGKKIRKQNTKFRGIKISWELAQQLMRFLAIDYEELQKYLDSPVV